jgi:hypothetical protein
MALEVAIASPAGEPPSGSASARAPAAAATASPADSGVASTVSARGNGVASSTASSGQLRPHAQALARSKQQHQQQSAANVGGSPPSSTASASSAASAAAAANMTSPPGFGGGSLGVGTNSTSSPTTPLDALKTIEARTRDRKSMAVAQQSQRFSDGSDSRASTATTNGVGNVTSGVFAGASASRRLSTGASLGSAGAVILILQHADAILMKLQR